MNIVVCIKQVPETSKVEIDPATGVLMRGGIASKMNPYDLYALETGLQLRNTYGGKLTVLSMGPPQAQQVIREAYAMGADAGVLLSDRRFGGADVLATAYTLTQGIEKLGAVDLILCGKQTTDGDTAQVGSEISEYLDIPAVANVSRIDAVSDQSITVEMELSEHVQAVTVSFPCLLSVEKDIVQPRLPSYVRKQAMKDTPITILTLDHLADKAEHHYGLSGSPTQVQRVFAPKPRAQRELWQGEGTNLTNRLMRLLEEKKLLP